MPDCWVFLILILENSVSISVVIFRNTPPPNIQLGLPLRPYFTVWSQLCVTGTNTEGPSLTLVIMFVKVTVWSETA
jgi:hypothetical protein